MAIIDFPVNPVNGQIYPVNPLPGQSVYYWDSTYQTWRLTGSATGVAAATYGTASSVPRITVDVTGRITFAENVDIALDASSIAVNPLVNGFDNVQSVIESAVYDVTSTNLSVNRPSAGEITVTLPDTAVSPGFYSYASFTVDPQGRIVSATSGTPTNVDVTSPIVNTGIPSNPVIGILPSTTTQAGAVQLNDTVTSNATNLALTAAQGRVLQEQINALSVAGSLNYAGGFDASTSQMITVTVNGAAKGFAVGSNIPSPSTAIVDYFVIVNVPGTYTPPGGVSALALEKGDWLFCNGAKWSKINIGSNIPYASTTSPGTVILSTDSDTQAGTDATKAVTPASLTSRVATEDNSGLAEIATQSEVDDGINDSKFITPLKLATYVSGGLNQGIPASKIVANPPINGEINVQNLLEDSVYSVSSSNLAVTETDTGRITVNLPNTAVSPGSYTNASITVDSVGRLTAAASGTPPQTTVVAPIVNTGTVTQPTIGIQSASTSQPGAVQLSDTLTSNAVNLALTAAQGKILQDQINVLSVAGNLAFSGTFNASTSQMVTVTIDGADAGFTVGANLPPPSTSIADHFVIVTTPGIYTPPGSPLAFDLGQGAWLFCNGTEWVKVDLASKVPSASETSEGVVRLATDAETQAGTDASIAVTPAGLSSRTATETNTGLSAIATQADVDSGVDDTRFLTPLKLSTYLSGGGGNIPASGIVVNPAINGNSDVQASLEDAVYNVASVGNTITVTEAATGQVNVDLPSTGVTPGSYDYATISVDSQGRITLASTNTLPVASTSTPGIVQLVDDTVTNDNTQALTASAGVSLQQQIDALAAVSNLTLAGTLDASTGLLLAVSTKGFAAGFVSGDPLPGASATNEEFFVIVTVPGDYAPPGGSSISTNDGDWFVSNGTDWVYYNVGPNISAATLIQFDDISGQFNDSLTTFGLQVGGSAYTPDSQSSILISLGGILQIPGDSFTVSGSSITFVEAPQTGSTFVGYSIGGMTGGGGGGGTGSGTVTLVNTGTGLIGGPIVASGTISLVPATTSTLGGVIPDGTTITVSPTGVISAVGGGGSVGTLQEVTDAGATTTNGITVGGLQSTGDTVLGDSSADNLSIPARIISSLIPGVGSHSLGQPGSAWRNLYVDLLTQTGSLIAAGLSYPTADGTSGQVLTTNGAGTLSWTTTGGGSVGTLQTVTDNGATTTNTITVESSLDPATENVKVYSNLVNVRNGRIQVQTDGQPGINIDGVGTPYITVFGGGYISLGTGTTSFSEKIRLDGNTGKVGINGPTGIATLTVNGTIDSDTVNTTGAFQVEKTGSTAALISGDAGSSFVPTLRIAGLEYPTTDGTAGQFLTTDGAGTLSWGTGGGGSVGTLQDVTNNGATTTNSITVGGLTAASLSYPTTDGTSGQVLTTDGAGALSWSSVSLPSRTVVSGTTASVDYLDLVTLDIQGFKSYLLMKIECDDSAWVRLYTDPDARTADLTRNIGNDPNPGSGVIAEANIVAPATTSIMSPFTAGGNLETPETDTIYLTVQNLSGVTRAFNVSLTVLQLEI